MIHQTPSPVACGGVPALIRKGGEQGPTGGFSGTAVKRVAGLGVFLRTHAQNPPRPVAAPGWGICTKSRGNQ